MEWKEVRLGDVCISISDGDHNPPPKVEDGIPFVTIANIDSNNCLDFTKTFFVPREYYEKVDSKRKPQAGDILYSVVGTFGKAIFVKENREFVFQRHIAILRPDSNVIDNHYLYYAMASPAFYHQADQMAVGAVQRTIGLTSLRKATINLPPLSTQRRISSVLSSLDRKIELNNKINATLEEMAQALFKSWFVDFEPFKNGNFIDSEIGKIPEGWRVVKAEDIYKINIGKTPPRKEPQWFSNDSTDNVWVSIADMGSCGAFISNSSEYLTDEAVNKHNIIMVDEGTVLLSFKLTIGRVAIAATRLTTNEAIARFILPDASHLEFLYLCLKQYNYAALGSTSSIATAVNSKTIKAMPLLMPSDKALQEFSNIAAPMFKRIKKLSQETLTLSHLRDTLLPRLMSGEIEV